MSTTAPWLALAVDWMDSEMFEDSTHGERLAWICLLCHVKSKGRAGRAKMNEKTFTRQYELSERAVKGMIERAQKCAAATLHDGIINVCNWRAYQDPKARSTKPEQGQFSKTPKNNATHHPSPITQKPKPPQPPHGGAYPPEFENLWIAYGRKGAKREAFRRWGSARPDLKAIHGDTWAEWLTDRAKVYRQIVPPAEFKFTKDLERWISGGGYDFDEAALRQKHAVEPEKKPVGDAAKATAEYLERMRREEAEARPLSAYTKGTKP